MPLISEVYIHIITQNTYHIDNFQKNKIKKISLTKIIMKKQSVKKWLKGWFNKNQKNPSENSTLPQTTSLKQQSWTQAEAQIINHLINMDSIIKISKQISQQEYATLYTINQILCKQTIDLNDARKALIGGIRAITEQKESKYTTKQLPFQYYSVRSLLWKVCVGYLTPDCKEKWVSFMEKNLFMYKKYVVQYIVNPIEKKLGIGTQNVTPQLRKQNSNQQKVKKDHPLNFSQQSKWGNYFKDVQLWKQIQKDIKRTRKNCKFFEQPHQVDIETEQVSIKSSLITFSPEPQSQTYADSLTRILFIYLKNHPNQVYCQGMNQLVALIYYCFTNKNSQYFRRVSQSDTYFVFEMIMNRMHRKHFQKGQEYAKQFITNMKKLDLRLYQEIQKNKSTQMMKLVTMKWFLSGFLTQFNIDESLIIWDVFITWPNQHAYFTECFTYMALSIVHLSRQQILQGQNIATIFSKINNPCHQVVEKTQNLYKLFPKLMQK